MKTHSGAKKRFKVTGSAKVRARHAFTSHILVKKWPNRKHRHGLPAEIGPHGATRVKRLLGAKTKWPASSAPSTPRRSAAPR